MDKKFWAIVGVIIVLFVGFLVINNRSTSEQKATTSAAQPTSHTRGTGKTVTLLEYADFQCPACAGYYSVLEQVHQKYGDQITMQFRHFPLTSIHRNAYAASRAAEAAGKQGKFWEMYQKLYGNQQVWSSSTNATTFFDTYAKELGLDVAKFQNDYISNGVNDAIKADMAAGTKLGVNSTPTFFINGKQITLPAQSVDAFSEVIDKALAEANKQQ